MISEETRYLLALNEIDDIGSISIKKLLHKFGSFKKIFEAEIEEITSLSGIKHETAKAIKNFKGWNKVDSLIENCQKNNIKIYTINDEKYPGLLKEIYSPPPILFCKGELQQADYFGIAVVGSRKMTDYGRRITEKLSSELASCGITVVSGLARGIDSVAHNAALSSGGRTVAVLGSGLNNIYPPENKALAQKIAESGAVLSEFYPYETPKRENFPRRNRIISGMTIGTLVTEADIRSGALITASFALEQGREVFAVPGNITSKNSEGTNYLIKNGAKLVQKVEDILEEIGQFIPSLKELTHKQIESKIVELNGEEKTIFDAVENPVSLDEIILKTGINTSRVLEALLMLEIKGLVIKSEGKYVRR